MPVSTPYRVTPQLGPQLDEVFTQAYYDPAVTPTIASPRLGNTEMGNDGGEYFFVKASADIAATATTGTQVTITFPAYTVATGAGGFYTKPATAVTNGQFLWVRRGAFNALPT